MGGEGVVQIFKHWHMKTGANPGASPGEAKREKLKYQMWVWGEKEVEGKKKEARLVLMHVRVASAAEQGQEVVESIWGRNKGSLLHGSLPQLGGTLSHSYEVWPPQTIKRTPFTLLDFIWNHAVEWITQRQPGIKQEWHLSYALNTWPTGEILICTLWNQTYTVLSLRPDTSFKIGLFRGQAIFVEPPLTVHSSVSQSLASRPERDKSVMTSWSGLQ